MNESHRIRPARSASRRSRLARLWPICLAVLVAVAARPASAQEPPDTALVDVVLTDGSVVQGRIIADGDPLRLRMPSGDVLEIARVRVRGIRPAQARFVDGRLWPEDPNRTSLFLGPTARTLPSGKGYVGAYELFFPLIGVGAGDYVTLAGGAPILGDLLEEGVFYLAPKVRFPGTGPRVDVAVGGLIFIAGDDGTAGVLYGVTTIGSVDRSVTLGALLPWVDRDWAEEPFFMIGAESRVSPSVKFMTENYISTDGGLVTFGPRFIGGRLSADLGVAIPIVDGAGSVFPIINFLFRF